MKEKPKRRGKKKIFFHERAPSTSRSNTYRGDIRYDVDEGKNNKDGGNVIYIYRRMYNNWLEYSQIIRVTYRRRE